MGKKKKQKPSDIRTTLYVEGMHCAACEVLIRQELEKVDGVKSAKASTSKGQVILTHEKGTSPNIKILNQPLQEHGYTLSFSKEEKTQKSLFQKFTTIVVIVLFITVFLWLINSGLAAQVMVTAESSPIVYLLFGLVAGASTCAALVGGVLLSLSKSWNQTYLTTQNRFRALFPHALFYCGRLVVFAFAGGTLALIGASITSVVTVIAPVITLLVAALMLMLGLQMLNVSWANQFVLALPGNLGGKVVDSSGNTRSRLSPFYVGLASILLPCGMTLTAFLTVIASGSFVQGAVNMFAFAFGTMLSLSIISLVSVGIGTQKAWAGRFNTIAGGIVIFFALFTLNTQLDAFGLPSMSDVVRFTDSAEDSSAVVLGEQGVQVMEMEASRYGYSPTSFTVKAGIPVRWEINNTGASGCTNAIIARGLINGEFPLRSGMNVVEFTPEKPGTYKFSCWMGMVGGFIRVI